MAGVGYPGRQLTLGSGAIPASRVGPQGTPLNALTSPPLPLSHWTLPLQAKVCKGQRLASHPFPAALAPQSRVLSPRAASGPLHQVSLLATPDSQRMQPERPGRLSPTASWWG